MTLRPLLLCLSLTAGCARGISVGSPAPAAVRPGISVLLSDSIGLIRGRRIGLLTNQTGIDEHQVSDIDLLRGAAATSANVRLVRLFSPEHGIRGTEDREHIASGIDERSGLPVFSLYDASTAPPPDSLLRDLDAIVIDLQDIGTRTWTYVGAMLYTLQSAARLKVRVIVVDRPNPITGSHTDGPFLDTALSNPNPPRPGKAGRAYALYPVPLRHGLTMGEMARFLDDALTLHTDLRIAPALGWRRSMWFDETGLPWVKPSPNMPNVASALLYPALVPFEGSNVSVGRGTPDPFQRFGAPWMNAVGVVARLSAMSLPGLRFEVDSFAPQSPGDNKYDKRRIAGVHITAVDRNAVETGTLSMAILTAIRATTPDSLRITTATFDDRFGSSAIRAAVVQGVDFGPMMDRERVIAHQFAEQARRFWIYH